MSISILLHANIRVDSLGKITECETEWKTKIGMSNDSEICSDSLNAFEIALFAKYSISHLFSALSLAYTAFEVSAVEKNNFLRNQHLDFSIILRIYISLFIKSQLHVISCLKIARILFWRKYLFVFEISYTISIRLFFIGLYYTFYRSLFYVLWCAEQI